MAPAVGFPAEDMNEANVAEWKELVGTAQCSRCGGLMVVEQCFDFLDDSGHLSFFAAARRSREKRERFKELCMLKINMRIEVGVMDFELEGKLAGPWVKELELCWRSAVDTQQIYPVRVDLSSVTFIDEDGKTLLGRMYREGAKLVATGCLNKCIVEGIMHSEEKRAEG